MKARLSTTSELKNYSLGRMVTKVEETVYMISFENGFIVSFDSFVRELFNESKNYAFRCECDKVRRSKSLKVMQGFIERNKVNYINIMTRELPLIFTFN
ncbi:hypothetical protein E2605_18505 [Dysgonomonas capnocytophagoides]|uniref:Uncharacterized protein n=1 Tax=Dysgonomonas capnocytophagoides TaxID=45254 RepID=A0A4Y8KYH3_9BACT|nr:hypothetical protein [Dysgonomonas capnocytophagoides]TFD92553.1 hypothetical protein E2605_18505 [Dysgonomonas capnocytophagoides]